MDDDRFAILFIGVLVLFAAFIIGAAFRVEMAEQEHLHEQRMELLRLCSEAPALPACAGIGDD